MPPKTRRLFWAVMAGLVFWLGDSVLPEMIGRGWTLIIFAAVPFVVGLAFLGRATRAPGLRWGVLAAVAWYAILFMDAARTPDPPLAALIPTSAVGLAVWSAISIQAYAAWKRASERSA